MSSFGYCHAFLLSTSGVVGVEIFHPNHTSGRQQESMKIPKAAHTSSDIKVRELDITRIVHYEFVPTGQTVNQVYYLEVLKRLREKVRRKRPELFANTHGSCITTMHLLIRHCLEGSF